MTWKPKALSGLFILGLSLAACNSGDSQPETPKPQATADTSLSQAQPEPAASPAPKEFDRSTHNLTCLLAGMPVDSNSSLYSYTQSKEWQAYAQKMDQSWAQTEAQRFAKMRTWVEAELGDLHALGGDLFYPFSGPDAFHASMFFPKATGYSLFAMEPAGNLPDMKGATNAQMMNYCNSVQNAIKDFFNSSFFYTIHMAKDMKVANGTAPVIAVFLARLGHTIVSVEPMMINEAGDLVPSTEKEHISIRVTFVDGKDGKQKFLDYHSCDVSDEGFAKRPALLRHVEKKASNVTFTKSASYLMHRPNFSKIKDLILAKAPGVLQDDTGIPFKFYKPEVWSVQFYGKYSGPIGLFASRIEQDLIQAYKSQGSKDLPFTMGYHSKNQNDNVIKYLRKK